MQIINKMRIKAMESIRKTNALKYYDEFIQNQWKSYDELKSIQDKKLKQLIQHCYENVKYYRNYMDFHNLTPDDILKTEDLIKMPILTKSIIRKEKQKIIASNAESFQPEEKGTGGSTGEPLRYLLPKASHSLMWANIWRGWNAAGYQPGDRVAVLAGSSLLSGFNFKRSAYYWLNNWLPLSSFNMDDNKMREYVNNIKKEKIQFLYAYASSAYELANFILKENLKGGFKLKGVITTAEVLFDHYREKIEEAFDCKVFNQYGANDGGVSAFECELHDGLHIGMERCIVEIVDDYGQPVEKGKEGKILLTDLSNYAMPFIRYEVGDLGAFSKSLCKCGRGLEKFEYIKGRQQEFVFSKNNQKIHGEFFSHLFRQSDLVEQFQVIQEHKGKIKILVKLNRKDEENLLNELKTKIIKKEIFNEVVIDQTEDFIKTKGGKHKFVINNVKE
ncbi:phenylacetate--CoA ligase family protein [Bacillus alveayuensis]|uniref:phenylacetate--CoA ligase family protein n=1 Tax=Aeribacillus alveayuensis TaxID=279215 RepID=UPI000697FFA7|nr:phenylacetate--CoA ligase family protein [Bacillus alveayuensis]